MKNTKVLLILALVLLVGGLAFSQTNYTRIVLGSGNFGTDPNPTADITGQNDEYISNSTNGRWDFGSANILTTGTISSGAGTLTGLTSIDSAAIAGMLRIGGVVNYNSRLTLKNTVEFTHLLQLFNSRSSTMFYVDSSGKASAETLLVTGNTRLGGLAAYGSRLSVENDATNSYVQSWYNSRNTQLASVDSSGKLNADTLTIDGNSRLGGLAAYGSRVSIKNDATNPTAFNVYNSRNTSIASIDSSGKALAETLTVNGNTRLGGLSAYGSRLAVKNDATNDYVQSWYNSRNTQLASVDSSGTLNSDTLTIDGDTRLGGLAAYGSRLAVKNDATNPTLLNLYNSRNTSVFSVDSAGTALAETLTTNGNSRLGGLASYGSRFSVKNDAVNTDIATFNNSRNTALVSIDSSGAIKASSAVADTFAFSTTAGWHAIYIPGALSSDVYAISKRLVQGESTVFNTDSLAWQYMAKPDSLIILRPNSNLVSGAKGSYIRFKIN